MSSIRSAGLASDGGSTGNDAFGPHAIHIGSRSIASITPLQAACRAVRRLGREPRILISAGSDDQRFVVHRAGITNSLVYGPGTTGLSHISDERISVEDLVLGTKGLALILRDLFEA